MNYDEIKEKINNKIEEYESEFWALNEYIADHPELSGKEYETSRKLVDVLEKYGFTIEYPFAGIETAFCGVYGENSHKHKVAILTEYDALPELGHACGHCLSGAISILAGTVMKDLQDELDIDIHIIGTPNEEEDGAKAYMAETGIFNQYDMAIMVHLYNRNIVMPRFQALATFTYEFTGKAAHASAAPWEGRNALNGVQLMLHAVDMLRQHSKKDAQFHSVIKNGGTVPGIVPEKASLEIYIRAESKEYLEQLIRMVDDCARGASIATQTTWAKYAPDDLYYLDLRPNNTGENLLRQAFLELDIQENGDRNIIFGSSDIGNVSYSCPAFHPCLQVIDDAPIHTVEFEQAMKTEKAHKALVKGANLIGLYITKVFNNQDAIELMKKDFIENTK